MIVDAHTHLLQPSISESGILDLPREDRLNHAFASGNAQELIQKANTNDLILSMNNAGIDKSIVFGFPWNAHKHCVENNDYVLAAIKSNPDQLIGFCVVQPNSGRAAIRELERCLSNGMQGVKLKPSWQGYELDDFDITGELLHYMSCNHIPLLVHCTQAYKEPAGDHPYHILSVARKFPKLRIVAAHLGGGLFLYELYQPVKEILKNVLFDLSLCRTMNIVRVATEILPASKLLFGTDYPFNDFGDQMTILRRLRETVSDDSILAAILKADGLMSIFQNTQKSSEYIRGEELKCR